MSKNRKTGSTEKDIVKKQFISLQQLDSRIDVVNIVSRYKESKNELGKNTGHLNYNNYKELSQKILRDEEFTISLIDDSFINLYYVFDEDDNIERHVLSFVPSYQNDLYREDMNIGDYSQLQPEEDANITDEEYGRRISNYIRVDYDLVGQKRFYHTPVHMHVGIFDYSIRMPVETALYPFDFLYLVFKYIYHYSEEDLDILNSNSKYRTMLDKEEMKRFKITNGNQQLTN